MGLWSAITDRFKPKPPKKQPAELELLRALSNLGNRQQRGSYDAARQGDDLSLYWQNADRFDADSANRRDVRETLVQRSRYELTNNGYSDGIAQTYCTDLIGAGSGPQLRMQTGSTGFNQMIELRWFEWCEEIHFRRKLWTMAHAKHGDGEAFAIMGINPKLEHKVKLDLFLRETEHCQTPLLMFNEPGHIDGIRFDQWNNIVAYDFLKSHPGSALGLPSLVYETLASEKVLHWFKQRRPGQHRGVPECASTLNLGAAFRRLREANLSTAEKVAAWTLFLKTMFQPDELQPVTQMSTLDIMHGMMTALPNSVEPFQLRAEHPGPSYDSFHKSLLNEQARPKNMPYNKAACDSSSYNYASGRLDHSTYYGGMDDDRADCNDLVLNRVFKVWFNIAIKEFRWLGGNPETVTSGARSHRWDWPKHRVADVEAEANANDKKLRGGQIFIDRLFSEAGLDFEDEIAAAAKSFEIEPKELKQRLLDMLIPKSAPAGGPGQPAVPSAPGQPADDEEEAGVAALTKLAALLKERGLVAANGHASLVGASVLEAGFCPTGPGGGIDNSCGKEGGGSDKQDTDKKDAQDKKESSDRKDKSSKSASVQKIKSEPTTPPPPGAANIVDVDNDSNGDGITDSARVGVAGDSVPREIPRMPYLNPDERKVESEFAKAYEADPEKMAAGIREAAVARAAEKGGPPVFETDAAKNAHAGWRGDGMTEEQRSAFRATMNVPLHQTANAATKMAFVQHLDTLKPGDEIMVTVGGCGAGKGWAQGNLPEAKELTSRSAAVWDSAGDQNATENHWIQKEAEARGLKVNYLHVEANPEARWADPKMGVVQRASKPTDGRMVDAKVFADSYVLGAQNHQAFYEKNKDNPNAKFIFADVTGSAPKIVDGISEKALSLDRHKLFDFAVGVIDNAPPPPVTPNVKHGALVGARVFQDAD